MYLKYLDKFEKFPTPKQGKMFIIIYARKKVLKYSSKTCWAQSFRFLYFEHSLWTVPP